MPGKKSKPEREKKYIQAIHDAIRRGSFSDSKKLLKRIPVSAGNSTQQTPLHTASAEGQVQILQYLLKKNADVNAKDRDGWTPLHCACHSGHLKIVELLIANHAEVSAETVNGLVPFDYFVRMEEQDTFSLLFENLFRTMIRKGVDVNKNDKQGDTPLHMAASKGKDLSIKLLLLNQANTNETNKNGETALHVATKNGHVKSIKLLLNAKTDWSITGNNGNCVDVALKTNRSNVINAFKEYLGEELFDKVNNGEYTPTTEHSRGISNWSPREDVTFENQSEKPSAITPEALSPVISLRHMNESETIEEAPTIFKKNEILSPRFNEKSQSDPFHPGTWNSYKLNPGPNSSILPTNIKISPKEQRNFQKTKTRSTANSPRGASPATQRRKRAQSSTKNRAKSSDEVFSVPPPPKTIESYVIGECVGSGGFGSVHVAQDKNTGAIVAVKQIPLQGIPKDELSTVMAELRLMQRLEYKHITKCLGFSKDEHYLHIILEFVEGGSLADIILKYGGVKEQLCARYVGQILLGMDYLHLQGIVHRDIKCANILVTKEGFVKLADFGIASVVDTTAVVSVHEDDERDASGSPYWMAPEVIQLEGSSTSSDIWSLGCTIIELLSGNPPFGDLPPMAALFAMVKNQHPPFPPDLSPDLEDFLLQCFQKAPEKRPTCKELFSHPWIQNLVPDLVKENNF